MADNRSRGSSAQFLASWMSTMDRRRRLIRWIRRAMILSIGLLILLTAAMTTGDIRLWRGRIIGAERRGDSLVVYRVRWGVVYEEIQGGPR